MRAVVPLSSATAAAGIPCSCAVVAHTVAFHLAQPLSNHGLAVEVVRCHGPIRCVHAPSRIRWLGGGSHGRRFAWRSRRRVGRRPGGRQRWDGGGIGARTCCRISVGLAVGLAIFAVTGMSRTSSPSTSLHIDDRCWSRASYGTVDRTERESSRKLARDLSS